MIHWKLEHSCQVTEYKKLCSPSPIAMGPISNCRWSGLSPSPGLLFEIRVGPGYCSVRSSRAHEQPNLKPLTSSEWAQWVDVPLIYAILFVTFCSHLHHSISMASLSPLSSLFNQPQSALRFKLQRCCSSLTLSSLSKPHPSLSLLSTPPLRWAPLLVSSRSFSLPSNKSHLSNVGPAPSLRQFVLGAVAPSESSQDRWELDFRL